MSNEIPLESLWLSYNKDIHFKLDEVAAELVCKKNINGRIHTIVRKIPESISELNRTLCRFVNLPDEFWKPIE